MAETGIRMASENSAGMILMSVGVLSLTINDAMAKALTENYSPLQILFIRNLIAFPFALAVAYALQGSEGLKSRRVGVHMIRGIFWIIATFTFFTSFRYLGLAKSTAIFFIAPLLTVVIAALFLGERASWKQWAAIVAGLVGMLLIVRPGFGAFEPVTLLPVITALMAACMMLSARWVDPAESVWTLLVWLTGTGTLISGCLVGFVWSDVPPEHYWLFAGVALFGTAGITMISQAFRVAPAVVVAPLDYTALLWATLLGWMFWAEIPDALTYIGAAIIASGGIFTLMIGQDKAAH